MTSPAVKIDADAPPGPSKARQMLLRRLADVVCLPASRINAFERAVTGDLLVDLLRQASVEERRRVAVRLAPLAELPDSLARLLLRDEPSVAAPLIEQCAALTDVDLIGCARDAGLEHRLLIAERRGLSEVVTEALLSLGEEAVVEAVLRNASARLAQAAIEGVVAISRQSRGLCAPLLKRPELRPSGAYVMFWWCGAEERRVILQRFAVSREVLQDSVEDLFALVAAEGWSDPVTRKALQFIERRQRNRAAIDKSPYSGLEAAVAAAARGMTRELVGEIGYLSGVKPLTSAKIMGDVGGEPLAILCKATGLSRLDLQLLWQGLRRPEVTADGEVHPDWERVQITYEMLAVDRAQTVLRYWNWSLSSALTPTLLQAIREGDEDLIDEYSAPERAAMLALADNFGR
ncbi:MULTISPECIES: DUF2336 domain-containing protein [unclassified Brevundimonas]|uniref:DUF2336 domain-containing protein n=1 Tax=unclassified Brevundimonas TaxID=2622653 RepID=UPI000CFB38D2|nr:MULTISPECIES: DUF2336 domain-containing protein [unclassified Brevundimonas]PRA21290.1 hypothetical protein CQ024_16140 [Brevundimonas sp. MYb27]PQZ73231.1 hypothetical protein CQ026_16320 [Brevundimonas sp. MYb31]PRB15434.1 hypothetical protein CQ039_08495 [Brevundimonas sp. MYb52]PRB32515.1 hypothetical protein CQ035_15820 [Brevundimonas sp. MYb46]PRB40513.1 hypothetical protein CQ028_16190 [Brevundimonas sp. MYb33]